MFCPPCFHGQLQTFTIRIIISITMGKMPELAVLVKMLMCAQVKLESQRQYISTIALTFVHRCFLNVVL